MSRTVSKNLPYQILFALCVSVTYLNNYELTFAVWSLSILATLKKRYSMTLVHLLACFAGIFAVAFVVAFFKEFPFYVYVRDVTYLLKPILGILLGYQLCRNYEVKPFETIIYTSLFIGVIHIGIIFYSAMYYKILNIHELRFYGGYFGDFEFFALIFLFFSKEFQLDISQKRKWLLLLVIGFSAFLYVSRINFIQFFIILLALKGYFRLTKRAIIIMTTFIVVVGTSYTIIYNMHLSRNGNGMEAFLFKIKNAPIEAFKTKVDKDDWQDFNDNYRSFENIITVKQVSYDGTVTTLFGKGMGSRIDLGRKLWTNDQEFIRYIPMLHNAFMTIFLKSGLVGIILCLIFLYLLGRRKASTDPVVHQLNLFFLGMAIFMLFAHWVLMGFYLKTDNKALVVGFLLCYREILIKRTRELPQHE
ncbi:MAG: hypothetical protein EOO50_03530 [Flavobacterium sp.]|uniref:hypothetical protein n=1 Tax=Flavobacterium sp. TaxID=239 RepID=UPI0012123A6A|nr:hypothetical protein [Flavobacterium sp.]RZJ67905.1 MAG: hypothetical protein EOO50_03530 [Flavobacterium sp.]